MSVEQTVSKDKDFVSLWGRGHVCFLANIIKIMFLSGAKVDLVC